MATAEQCQAYKDCGFVKWRQARPDLHMLPLPPDGNCGIEVKTCPRYKYATTDDEILRDQTNGVFHVENAYTHKLPITKEEIISVFPLLPNKNNRPKRRIVGGGHR